jgi:hypothetical protein
MESEGEGRGREWMIRCKKSSSEGEKCSSAQEKEGE